MPSDDADPLPPLGLRFGAPLRMRLSGIGSSARAGVMDEYLPHLDPDTGQPDIDVSMLDSPAAAREGETVLSGPRGSKLVFRVEAAGPGRWCVGIRPAAPPSPRLSAHGAIRHVIEPILYAALPARGAAFVHGGAAALAGKGIAVFGTRGSGKTAAILDLIGAGREKEKGAHRAAFLAGDKFMLGRDGVASPYARCQHLSAYTLKRFPGALAHMRKAQGRGLTGAIATRLRLWRKGEIRCRIEAVVPGALIGGSAKLAAAVWLVRPGRKQLRTQAVEMPGPELAALVLDDIRREFSRAEALARAKAFAAGEPGGEEIIRDALRGVRAFRVAVADGLSPRELGDCIRGIV